jgi:hypothetical protein
MVNTSSRLIAVASFLALCACSKKQEVNAVPAGPLMGQSIHFVFAIYYLPKPRTDPSAALLNALAKDNIQLKLAGQMPDAPSEPLVYGHLLTNVHEQYAPPDVSSLRYFGRGITDSEAQALQKSEQAFILDFGHSKQDIWKSLRVANELAEELARQTNGRSLMGRTDTRGFFNRRMAS